ncbi:phosphatidate cytidylyltransferase [Sphingomonas sp. HDW15A]|uniref:phosphatidate cytidylyltransferase n=1 Tax=Sphingomonas sp. HDW15A TaxID=2714942 RepID=UPI00140A9DA7|nr:phosphatidate cytidylyltransferase [Sphingomonas sp. HDW15A]QIK96046.1 phosphatidate cytidylyltransferase [Sphingomonas sp. HDW15A]
MSDLALRSLSGITLILIALAAAFLGGYVFAVLAASAAVLMFAEWRKITSGWGFAWSAAGFFYALLPALALLWIRDRADQGFELLIWVFIVTWSTDIGAYFAGRAIGGPKLAPSISPNKTIAGLFGGIVSAGLAGFAWSQFAHLPALLIWVAPLLAVAAQVGDLFESWMKRKAGVKDSGTWLPGHGGALDRLDGLVPVAVITAALVLGGYA